MKYSALTFGPGCLLLTGCATKVPGVHIITQDEAQATGCERLQYVGTVSIVLINGRGGTISDILKAANKIPGATPVWFPSDKPSRVYAGADVRHCENPNLTTADQQTERFDRKFMSRQSPAGSLKALIALSIRALRSLKIAVDRFPKFCCLCQTSLNCLILGV